MFEVIKTEGTARRGRFRCAHGGEVQTPVFMNVGTQGAIKGGGVRPRSEGDRLPDRAVQHLSPAPASRATTWCRQMGGLHQFMRLGRPHPHGLRRLPGVLPGRPAEDQGGGRHLRLPHRRPPASSWGRRSPCASSPIWAATSPWPLTSAWRIRPTYDYAKASCERTLRWLERCKAEHDRLNALPDCGQPRPDAVRHQPGGRPIADLRVWHMQEIAKLDCDGYAIGGLAVGEPTEVMYDIIEAVEPYMPARTSPGISWAWGPPATSSRAVARGVDFFDCVMPARNARHGKLFTWEGALNIKNEKYKLDDRPIDPELRLPGVPPLLPGLSPPPVHGGGDAGDASGGAAQSVLL